MNKNAKAWLKALRSGEYKQITGTLKKGVGFCCLGVACDLYSKDKNIRWEIDANDNGNWILGTYADLPSEVSTWLGMGDFASDPLVKYKKEQVALTRLNDTEKLSFKQIADAIESDWGVFE